MRTATDFKTADERQQFFLKHAEFYTAACRLDRFSYRSQHETLEEARQVAAYVAKTVGKVLMIYGVIGSCDLWLENVQPC